jgi:hypothetical protein
VVSSSDIPAVKPKQDAQRVHVPALRDHAEKRSQQPTEKAALRQQNVEILLDQTLAPPDGVEHPVHPDQYHGVGAGNRDQKERGHAGADQAADLLEMVEPRLQRADRKRHEDRRDDHDGRMPQREEEPDRNRPLPRLHQLACHIVDRRDVIGINRMTETERIGQQRGSEQNRIVPERDQRPEPGQAIGGQQDGIEHGHPGACIDWPIVKNTA